MGLMTPKGGGHGGTFEDVASGAVIYEDFIGYNTTDVSSDPSPLTHYKTAASSATMDTRSQGLLLLDVPAAAAEVSSVIWGNGLGLNSYNWVGEISFSILSAPALGNNYEFAVGFANENWSAGPTAPTKVALCSGSYGAEYTFALTDGVTPQNFSSPPAIRTPTLIRFSFNAATQGLTGTYSGESKTITVPDSVFYPIFYCRNVGGTGANQISVDYFRLKFLSR